MLLGSPDDGDIVGVRLGAKVGKIEGILVYDGSELGHLVGNTLTGSTVGFAIGANDTGLMHCGGAFGKHCPERQTNPGLQQPLLVVHD